MGRFGKRDDLVVHQEDPFIAETGVGALAEAVTDTAAFYVRNHGPVPEIDPDAWRLRVSGMVSCELSLSLRTLHEAFREQTVTATLQCAGNRRAGLIPPFATSRGKRSGAQALPEPRGGQASRWLTC
jgi:sulfite oxidase